MNPFRLEMYLVVVLILSVFSSAMVLAAGSGGGSGDSRLSPYQRLIKIGHYEQAIDQLEKALVRQPEDPDLLNLSGYSYRKLGRINKALNFYKKALAIEPDHQGANEYLGELYLELGDIDKALKRLAVLDDACLTTCEAYVDLKKAVTIYRQGHQD